MFITIFTVNYVTLVGQVKAGTIFDNILVCDDPDFAKAEAEKNIVPLQAKEKEAKRKADDDEAEKRRKEEVRCEVLILWCCLREWCISQCVKVWISWMHLVVKCIRDYCLVICLSAIRVCERCVYRRCDRAL